MLEDKEYSHDQEDTMSQSHSKSIISNIVASTNGLARSTFSSLSSNELPKSFAGVRGLEKAHSSGSHSNNGPNSNRENLENLPKIHQNYGLDGIRPAETEGCAVESEREFSSFLNDNFFLPIPKSPTGKSTIQISRPLVDPNLREIGSAHKFSIVEQEFHDGKDVVEILSNPASMSDEFEFSGPENMYDLQLPNGNIEFSESNGTNDNNLSLLESFKLPRQSEFDLFPDYGENMTDIHQWVELQDTYTDKVWGNFLENLESTHDIRSMDKRVQRNSEKIAQKRLAAILGHLKSRIPISYNLFLSHVQCRSILHKAA